MMAEKQQQQTSNGYSIVSWFNKTRNEYYSLNTD